ncbi:hypothetical protein U9M48_002152 [Paspalum notatum var. saurae]|uniref:Transposase n=1 Tax=Paspalum notatum var. saurae TaxID=547442 RepID=A0AAQ3PKH8_PASNO
MILMKKILWTGGKKKSILFILPYWEHLLLRHNIDVMHTEKNVCENFINTLLDDAKSKDNLQARLDLVELGIRHDLHPKLLENGRYDIPKAPFVMSREKKEILCSTIQNIKTPVGYASNISRCVDMKAFKLTGLKSHDCHILIEHLLPIALRTCYPNKDTMSVVVELSNFFKSLCSKVLDISEIENLQEQVVLTLCKMEKLFVPSFFTLMVHLIVHLLDEAKLGGPVHYRWMYPFERYFVRLKGYVRNRAQPEGCMAEGYIADECLTFCSEFLKDIRNSSIEETNSEEHRYLFDSFGEPIGAVKNVRLDAKTLIQAHRYVLRHIDDIESYRREFLEEEKKRRKQSTFTAVESEKLINEQFHDWFYQKVLLLNSGDADIPEKIVRLAEKPSNLGRQFSGLAINGFKFHTTSRENNRETQNSGVVNVSEDGDTNYYGQITEILELNYNGAFKVIMFKCDWYDVHHRVGMKQDEFGFTLLNSTRLIHTGHKLMDDPFVFSSQVEQLFYVQDGKHNDWCILIRVKPRDLFDMGRTEDRNVQEYTSAQVWHMAPMSRRIRNLDFVENSFQNEEINDMRRNSESVNNSDGQNITMEDLHNNFYEFHADGRMKRRRGHTKLADVEGLPEGTKIVVTLDRFNVPVSKSAAVLGSYLGTVVRKPHLAPLNLLKWNHKVFKQVYHKKMIDEVERKFAIDVKARKWLLNQLGNKWRQYKRQLKIKFYKPNLPLEHVLQNVPEIVDESQWASLVSYWYSDEAKEDKCGEEIDRATLFDACHKNKEGAYVNSITEEKMNKVYMILAEKRLDRDITEEDIEEAMNAAFGKDHSGRVRGMGPTITPSNYYGMRFGNSSGSNAPGTNNWKEAKGFMKFVMSFLQKKFPEEDLMSQAPKFLQEFAENCATRAAHNSSDGGESTSSDEAEYLEYPMQILDRAEKGTRTIRIPVCKVLWSNHSER